MIVNIFLQNPAIEVGDKYLKAGRPDLALEVYNQIYNISKDTPEGYLALYKMSLASLALGDTLSALADLNILRKKFLPDTLASNVYKSLINLEKDTLRRIGIGLEFVELYPEAASRKKILKLILQLASESNLESEKILRLMKINASDYYSKSTESELGYYFLTKQPSLALLISHYAQDKLLQARALFYLDSIVDAYMMFYSLQKDGVLRYEFLKILERGGLPEQEIARALVLAPEDEKTAFELARILFIKRLSVRKLQKYQEKNRLFESLLLAQKNPTKAIRFLLNQEEGTFRNYLLARLYAGLKSYANALYFAQKLPDSLIYNNFKIELAKQCLESGIHTKEIATLLKTVTRYYPLSERDSLIYVYNILNGFKDTILEQTLLENGIRLPSLPINVKDIIVKDPVQVIRLLYEKRHYEELLRFAKGKELPEDLKPVVVEALLNTGEAIKALKLIEKDATLYPGLYLKVLSELPPESIKNILLPKDQIKNTDIKYLYVIARKIKRPEILNKVKSNRAKFYYYLLTMKPDSAVLFYREGNKADLNILDSLLLLKGMYQKLIEISNNLNPLYPLDLKIIKYKVAAYKALSRFNDIIEELKDFESVVHDEYIRIHLAEAYLRTGKENKAFLLLLPLDSRVAMEMRSKILLKKNYIASIKKEYLSSEDRLSYYLKMKDIQKLLSFIPRNRNEALSILRFLVRSKKRDFFQEKTKEYLDSLIIKKPDVAYLLSLFYSLRGNTDSTLFYLPYAFDEAKAEPLFELGNYVLKAGKQEDAIPLFQRALQYASDTLKSLISFRLGNLMFLKKDYMNALNYYRMSLREKYRRIEKDILHNIVLCFKNLNEPDSVIHYYSLIRERYCTDSAWVSAGLSLGYFLLAHDRLEEAIGILDEIEGIGHEKDIVETLYWKSKAYIGRKMLRQALVLLQRIYVYHQHLADWRDTARLEAARIFIALGRKEKGIGLYKTVLKIRGSKDPLGAQAEKELKIFGD